MANATPALQAAYNATTAIPILGTSVTEYGVALGLSDFSGTVGGNEDLFAVAPSVFDGGLVAADMQLCALHRYRWSRPPSDRRCPAAYR